MGTVMRSLASNLLALCCCLPLLAAQASEVKYLDVTHEGELYTVSMDVLINAPMNEVWALMSDHRNLAKLSPDTRESVVLSRSTQSDSERIKVVLHPCLLLFCKDLVKISDVRKISGQKIRYTAVDGMGDFEQAVEVLEFVDQGQRTLMRYRASLDPAFKVPGLLGTSLMEHLIANDLRKTARNLEKFCPSGLVEKTVRYTEPRMRNR
ncbi:MAG: SRPBCC family protein [Pseudomonadota bacterium]|nr:SRPBCC family protein [Pseudomonadota bacterium]